MADSLPTLVLSNRFTADSVAIKDAARAVGWPVVRLSSWKAPPELAGKNLVVYAEPLFVACLGESLGMALIEPSLDWLAGLPEQYLLRDVTFGQLQDHLTRNQPRFLKPADDKSFPAKVYGVDEAVPAADTIPGETPVLSSEPVTFSVEYRVFVRDRQARTISPYGRYGELAQDEDGLWPAPPEEMEAAKSFTDELLQDQAVAVPPAVVIDVGLIEGRGWAVVEANPAWGSGRYGCDPAEVLHVVAGACRPLADLSDEERAWVIVREG